MKRYTDFFRASTLIFVLEGVALAFFMSADAQTPQFTTGNPQNEFAVQSPEDLQRLKDDIQNTTADTLTSSELDQAESKLLR